mgnify:CR=1 FL=1
MNLFKKKIFKTLLTESNKNTMKIFNNVKSNNGKFI